MCYPLNTFWRFGKNIESVYIHVFIWRQIKYVNIVVWVRYVIWVGVQPSRRHDATRRRSHGWPQLLRLRSWSVDGGGHPRVIGWDQPAARHRLDDLVGLARPVRPVSTHLSHGNWEKYRGSSTNKHPVGLVFHPFTTHHFLHGFEISPYCLRFAPRKFVGFQMFGLQTQLKKLYVP